VTFQSWAKSGNLHDVILVGFDDEASSWPAVYDTGMSCQVRPDNFLPQINKRSFPHSICRNKGPGQNGSGPSAIVNLVRYRYVMFSFPNLFFAEHLTTTEHNIRYWYLALSRCSPGEYEVEYKLQFTQGGGYWENQFSYDEWGQSSPTFSSSPFFFLLRFDHVERLILTFLIFT